MSEKTRPDQVVEQPGDGKAGDQAGSAKASPAPSPTPPRGPRVWVMGLVALAAIVAFVAGTKWGPSAEQRVRGLIVRVSQADRGDGTAEHEGDDESASHEFYTCGMHPWVILPDPGDCPICHMELTPLDPSKFTGEMSIDPVVTQNIGVRVAPVTSGPVVRTIRTVGTIEYDETSVRDVNIKVSGWIERLNVDYLGAEVKAGEPLFDLYSPKLYAAQGEYLSALRASRRGGDDLLPGTRLDSQRLLTDARVQLEYYDVTDKQIDALEASGEPTKTMTLLSPHTGVVISKHANEGMRVDPGMTVFRIADLSKVWVLVSLYEYQSPFVQEGQRAVMTLPYIPGQEFEGRVIYVYPYLDEKTRQLQVRLEFENPVGLLKPGMFASIELKSTLASEKTLAPRSAIIDTGQRSVAFVSLGEGRFEPRDVRMGVETSDGQVEILDGLKPGEMVVVSGQFLLDSEARVRESLAKMIRGDMAAEQESQVAVAGASQVSSLPADVASGLETILRSYFQIGDALASDSIERVGEPARQIATSIDSVLSIQIPDDRHFWHRHEEAATVRGSALKIAESSSLDEVRLSFANLSVALSTLIRATGVPDGFGVEVQELHCPMYRQGQGGSTWLQAAGDVRNPFFGSVMLECFDRREALPTTGAIEGEQ